MLWGDNGTQAWHKQAPSVVGRRKLYKSDAVAPAASLSSKFGVFETGVQHSRGVKYRLLNSNSRCTKPVDPQDSSSGVV